MKTKIKEADIVRIMKKNIPYFETLGITLWRNNTGSFTLKDRYVRFGMVGSPDFIGFTRHGKFCCVECKGTGCKPTAIQEEWLSHAEECDCNILILAPTDDNWFKMLSDVFTRWGKE